MYTYTAGSTGLDAAMPPWVQEGGYKAWAERLQDPEIRERVRREMTAPAPAWENLMLAAGGKGTLLVGFKNEALRQLRRQDARGGRARCAASRVQDTAMDLVVEDGSRVQVVYFLMSEDNVKRQIPLPWVSFGSDASSMAPEGAFIKTSTHPRAYGNFARLLGKYVRDEQVMPMEEAIRRLTLAAGRRRCASRSAASSRKATSPTSSSSIRRRSPTTSTYEKPHSVRHRREARLGQRRAGPQGRRAHRREARPGRARARLERRLPVRVVRPKPIRFLIWRHASRNQTMRRCSTPIRRRSSTPSTRSARRSSRSTSRAAAAPA